MSDRLYTYPLDRLFKWILAEEKDGKILGIYKENFFTPNKNDPFKINRYGKVLDTPIGVAAGPHTQLAQNIIASWLTGARYIELKTVQTLDEIEVTKPCIDMEDEGYNCEWSQELKIQESFDEYLNSWIIIHILKYKFGWDDIYPGFIFNMSVGYDLKGILNPNIQWFFEKMNNCKQLKENKIEIMEKYYPDINKVAIPDQISDNITLSTMHGCPPDEIERIGKYLIDERKLHTTIKLNPTLLGAEHVRNILNDKLGYKIVVPHDAFEHDLKYDEAIKIINSLKKSADEVGVDFGLKLTNTLESLNSTRWLPRKENIVYTSGRALHPLSINLASRLQSKFNGELDISFCAGIDAFNISDTLACNLRPVTVCTDLLKPGGYLRQIQYLEEIKKNILQVGSNSIDSLIKLKSGSGKTVAEAGLFNLNNYSNTVLENKRYNKKDFPYDNIKIERELNQFDCIHSPCVETCAVSQDVPEYMFFTATGEFDKAAKVILHDNPLPNITGNVCDHLCQSKCTRMNLDSPLLIKGIKRFISENFIDKKKIKQEERNGRKVAVIGAGPSGLSFSYFLAIEGFEVNVYESKSFAGGMTSDSIPQFRLSDKQISEDIKLIESLGVTFHFKHPINRELFYQLQLDHDFIYIGVGAQISKKMDIPGENLNGVLDQLGFLSKVRRKETIDLGNHVAVIGGGNSSIDAARTANRLLGQDGKVTVLYRRTKNEMPADSDEIRAMIEEGVDLLELTAPVSISVDNIDGLSLQCIKMKLGEPDDSGRRRPIPIQGSEFNLIFSTIIPSIGQKVNLDFVEDKTLLINAKTKETQFKNVFAGGDAVRGADSLINAISDGKKAAQTILLRIKDDHQSKQPKQANKLRYAEFQKKQAYRVYGPAMPEISLNERKSFNLVHPMLDEELVKKEAARCLFCNDVCNICVGVCPNFANISFASKPLVLPIFEVQQNNSGIEILKIDELCIKQKIQIVNISDFCNECGNCNTFCPTKDAPYKIKPKFCLTEKSFINEDNCYFLDGEILKYKSADQVESLTETDFTFIYDSNLVLAEYDKKDYSMKVIKFKSEIKEKMVFRNAVEMIFLHKNLNNLFFSKK